MDLMEERDKKLEELRRARDIRVEQEYKRLRNMCRDRVKRDKKEYEEKCDSEIEGQKMRKQLWSYVKKRAGWVSRAIPEGIDDGPIRKTERV